MVCTQLVSSTEEDHNSEIINYDHGAGSYAVFNHDAVPCVLVVVL